ncbi:hypothetical protein [Paraliomyxa miuraensis]|uniref:hypothetical protein n=1 Tax=Paraliomyxa miuraensis TaxID=376150 RepID=UPI00224D6C60|nr:hypothetical protein [Paraliomyxa miuraensis]
MPRPSPSIPTLTFLLSLGLLSSACPGDDGTGTTEAASSTGSTTDAPTTTGQPTTTSTIEPVTSSSSGSGSGSTTGSTSGVDSSTGAPSIPCESATTEEMCSVAGSMDFDCGWFPTRHFAIIDMMCMEVAQGGVCLTSSANDSTCGIMREASCMDGTTIVYVRPSSEQVDATETLALEEFDACTGPDPVDGWELCDPMVPVPGCRCGCG